MLYKLLQHVWSLVITSCMLFFFIFGADGAIISGLVQSTTVIAGKPSYFPFGQGDLPLSTKAGDPTQNTKTGYAVSSTPSASQPTLVYNCQQMAAICNNVQQWLDKVPGRQLPMEFTYDRTTGASYKAMRLLLQPSYLPSSKTWKAIRGNQMCGGVSWSKKICPESNQPTTIKSRFQTAWNVISVIARTDGSPGRVIEGIKDAAGKYLTRSGMQYTCDEFPPASFIEGGAGSDGSSPGTTYCAPQGVSCGLGKIDKKLDGAKVVTKPDPNDPAQKIFEQSEQDFQSKVHGYLASVIGKLYPGGSANVLYGAFQFTTLAAPNTTPDKTRAWVVIPTTVAGVPATETSEYVLKREAYSVPPIWHGIPPEYIRIEARYQNETIADDDGYITSATEIPQSYMDKRGTISTVGNPDLNSMSPEAGGDFVSIWTHIPLLYVGIPFSTFGAVVLGIFMLRVRRSHSQYVFLKV